MSGERVLLVDDEVEFAELLGERLQARGMRVDTAADGSSALELAGRRSYDVIILDMVMPGLDGMEVLRRLLGMDPTAQVIMLTGHAEVAKGVEAIKIGAMDYIEKPADLDALLRAIREGSARHAELAQERLRSRIDDILEKKGW